MGRLPAYGRLGTFTWRMLATVLGAEAVVIFFGALVARGVAAAADDPKAGTYLWVGSALAVLALLAAGSLRRPVGVTLGWVVQVATLASAFVVPMMLVIGLVFLALWLWCLVRGQQVDAAASADTVSP